MKYIILIISIVFIGGLIQGIIKGKKGNDKKKVPSIPLEKGGMRRISVNEFKDNLIAIPRDIFDKINDAIMEGKEYLYIKLSDYNTIIENIEKEIIRKRNEAFYFELFRNAEIYDKHKEIDKAIKGYEEAYNFAVKNKLRITAFAYCVERLAINYRKARQKEKEVKLLTYMLENYSDWNHSAYDNWNQRLAKLI